MSRTHSNLPTITSLPPSVTPPPVPVEVSSKKTSTALTFLSVILGVIIALGTVIGVGGRAFFVGREEYVKDTFDRATKETRIEGALNRLNEIMTSQSEDLKDLGQATADIKTSIVEMRVKLDKSRGTR
jgi:hypothetical protein